MKRKVFICMLLVGLLIITAGCNDDNHTEDPVTPTAASTQSPEPSTDDYFIDLSRTISESLAARDWDFTAEYIDESVKEQLSPEVLKTGVEPVVDALGQYIGIYDTYLMSKDAESIKTACILKYENNGIIYTYVFNISGKITGLWLNYYTIPDESELPEYLTEEDITIGKYELKGKLTLPNNVENPPVVLLIQGSGPNDMDETVGAVANKPFRDIAYGLAKNGIASMRYNKRYAQCPEAAAEGQTVEKEYLEDVKSAIEQIMTIEKVDTSRLFVLGHSQGGMLAPKIAYDNAEVKGLIIMAGTPRHLIDLIADQGVATLEAAGTKDTELELAKLQYEAMKTKVKALTTADTEEILGLPASYWASLNEIDTADITGKLNIPMLIMQGGADFQVYPDIDYKMWKDILASKLNISFGYFDNLNHIFMTTNGKEDSSEYDIKGSVNESVIEMIADWINQ